jgi:hypothetical protein
MRKVLPADVRHKSGWFMLWHMLLGAFALLALLAMGLLLYFAYVFFLVVYLMMTTEDGRYVRAPAEAVRRRSVRVRT